MLKFLIFLMIALFVVTPLVALLSSHDDCSKQACHIIMTNLFILTSVIVVLMIFLSTQLTNKASLFETLYSAEIFLPPRPVRS